MSLRPPRKRPARLPRSAPSRRGPGPARDRFAELPTEAVHPRAEALDTLDAAGIVRLLLEEEARAIAEVAAQAETIAALAERFAETIAGGGRVVYAGAGTSGRLGALDAAELPPTFGLDPSRVVAVLAGGPGALRRAVEGAEDRGAGGRTAIARLRAGAGDLVIGLAASGVTPFARAAVEEAHRRGCATAFITCGVNEHPAADLVIALAVGPEVVAGSTRLKAGTATKLVLNAVSTAAMIRLGSVYRGRLVDLRASNAKLRARALRTVEELGRVSPARAERLLRTAGGDVRLALAAALLGLPVPEAKRQLDRAGGRLANLPAPRRPR